MQPLTVLLALVLSLYAAPLAAQTTGVGPTPASHFGFTPGADRRLANWDELVAYYEKVAQASPRVSLNALCQTTGGKPFVMFTITSPENHARLAELHDIQLRLAEGSVVLFGFQRTTAARRSRPGRCSPMRCSADGAGR